ncbi:MAG: Fur family transcriptional regulator [Nitrospirota bacterium]
MHDIVFKEFLKRKGLKLTTERNAILKEIYSFHGHFDPEELLLRLRKKGTRVSKASIYRTIPLLLESGLIEEVIKVAKHSHYEHTYGHGHHDHMICLKCGSVVEFHSQELEDLQEKLCKKDGFRGISHTLEIRGYCKRCR